MTGYIHDDIDALLMEYACGMLEDDALCLLVASYITVKPEASRRVSCYESLGGALIECHCEPEAMASGSLADILTRIERGSADTAEETLPQPVQKADFIRDHDIPLSLCEYIAHSASRKKWRRYMRGVQYFNISTDSDRHKIFLMKLEPGAQPPAHEHSALEITLVLEGAFSDEHGSYGPGDIIVCNKDSRHQPVADVEKGCCCVVLLDGPLLFQTPLLKWLSSFFYRYSG